MASLQPYQSHGRRYYRIVESFRKDGKPHIRVLAHLGRAKDILRLCQDQRAEIKISSVSAGAVTALHHLAQELDIVGKINHAVANDRGRVQKRDDLTVGESLLAGMIGRACAPCSKRAFAGWARSTYLPQLMGFSAPELTSEHFWEQMHTVPVDKLAMIEQEIVREVIRIEQLQVEALAYDTTNFYTHIATTNEKPLLPQRGHNKQGRHDLRQLGLALVVDQSSQLPLAHVLYEGARSDMRTFAEFLMPVRQRLRELTQQPQQLTLVLWQQDRNVPFWQSRNVPLDFRETAPIPPCAHCAACGGTRQGFPPARAKTARGLDGTRRKQTTHFPHKREWELLEIDRGGHFYFAATLSRILLDNRG